jgi:hypothetical protein
MLHATSIKYQDENRDLRVAVFHLLDRPAMLRASFSLTRSAKGYPTTHPSLSLCPSLETESIAQIWAEGNPRS